MPASKEDIIVSMVKSGAAISYYSPTEDGFFKEIADDLMDGSLENPLNIVPALLFFLKDREIADTQKCQLLVALDNKGFNVTSEIILGSSPSVRVKLIERLIEEGRNLTPYFRKWESAGVALFQSIFVEEKNHACIEGVSGHMHRFSVDKYHLWSECDHLEHYDKILQLLVHMMMAVVNIQDEDELSGILYLDAVRIAIKKIINKVGEKAKKKNKEAEEKANGKPYARLWIVYYTPQVFWKDFENCLADMLIWPDIISYQKWQATQNAESKLKEFYLRCFPLLKEASLSLLEDASGDSLEKLIRRLGRIDSSDVQFTLNSSDVERFAKRSDLTKADISSFSRWFCAVTLPCDSVAKLIATSPLTYTKMIMLNNLGNLGKSPRATGDGIFGPTYKTTLCRTNVSVTAPPPSHIQPRR